jgi:hypothetical protein
MAEAVVRDRERLVGHATVIINRSGGSRGGAEVEGGEMARGRCFSVAYWAKSILACCGE